MKQILFVTYPRIGLARGGLQRQIDATADALARSGIEIVRYSPWSDQIKTADLVHCFSVDGSLLSHAEHAKTLSKRVVVSSVFNGMGDGPLMQWVKGALSRHVPGAWTDLERATRLLHLADRIVCLNETEAAALARIFRIPPDRCHLVPNGVDPRPADPELFWSQFGQRDFALIVGSIEPGKNQLAVIEALAGSTIPLVLVGAPKPDSTDYFDACKAAASGNVLFAGQLSFDDSLLYSAYAAARLLIVPSLREVMPMVVLEAASMGCPILLSSAVSAPEGVIPVGKGFDPGRRTAIAAEVERAWEITAARERRPSQLASWDDVAQRLLEVYRAT